ncbi:MAG: phosphatase PAP2 family protein [Pseudomonadota bacterium]|nr:phosphatase PAP2 family protein [Pseudomonadota bacterium]
MTWWPTLSSLGGLDITGPLALAIAAWLAGARNWCLALTWCLLFGAAMAVTAASQMAFIGWGVGVESLSFTGFSGHAMRAAAVIPVALFLLLEEKGARWQLVAVLAGALVAIGVAIARVKVGAHSPSEAWTGCLLGLITAGLFIARVRVARPDAPRPHVILLAMLTAAILLPRPEAMNSYQLLTAVTLALSGHDRVYERGDWQPAPMPYTPPCAPERVRFSFICT